jgi:hypothetical protein
MGPGEPDGEIVRLGSAVDEKNSVETFRRERRKPLGKLRHGSIVEPRIGVEQRPLPPDRSRQARMPVADERDVVDHIEISAPFDVEEMLLPAALDLRRRAVIVLLRPGIVPAAALEEPGRVRQGRVAIEAQDRCGRRAQPAPCLRLMRRSEGGRVHLRRRAKLDAHEPQGRRIAGDHADPCARLERVFGEVGCLHAVKMEMETFAREDQLAAALVEPAGKRRVHGSLPMQA